MDIKTKFSIGDTAYYCYIYDGKVKSIEHTIMKVVITNEGVFYGCDFVSKEYENLFPESSLCFKEEILDYELKTIEQQTKYLREKLEEQEMRKEELRKRLTEQEKRKEELLNGK